MKDCQLCGHDVDNHSREGCCVHGCKCERTHKHTDHPTYQEQAARIAELEEAVELLSAVTRSYSRAKRVIWLDNRGESVNHIAWTALAGSTNPTAIQAQTNERRKPNG